MTHEFDSNSVLSFEKIILETDVSNAAKWMAKGYMKLFAADIKGVTCYILGLVSSKELQSVISRVQARDTEKYLYT